MMSDGGGQHLSSLQNCPRPNLTNWINSIKSQLLIFQLIARPVICKYFCLTCHLQILQIFQHLIYYSLFDTVMIKINGMSPCCLDCEILFKQFIVLQIQLFRGVQCALFSSWGKGALIIGLFANILSFLCANMLNLFCWLNST